MNGIQGTKPAGRKWNILLDAYIKVLTGGTVSYLTVSNYYVINTTNNETEFPELTRVFEEHIEIKVKKGSVLKYLNFRISESPLGFSVDQNDHIMELVNEWFPTGKFRNIGTPFRTDSAYE